MPSATTRLLVGWRRAWVMVAIVGVVFVGGASEGLGADRPGSPALGLGGSSICRLPRGSTVLPAGALHGLIDHLREYPVVRLASPAQRAASRRVLAVAQAVSARFGDPRRAARAGYTTETRKRRAGDTTVHYLHAEFVRERKAGPIFDPRRPKALIYANQPGRPLRLVGVMYSVKRGQRGPSPGGPITRWHAHTVCSDGHRRGSKAEGRKCPRGMRLYQGSEMMHVWFTRDLRSAFAIGAPEPELCRDGLVSGPTCRSARSRRVM